jgi:hypothetical protein
MTTKILSGIYTTEFNLTTPVTTLTVSASGYLGAGLTATGTGTYTIVNDGHIVSSSAYALGLAGRGVVTNAGTISSTSTTSGAGVLLGNGGLITNEAGGLITGYFGIGVETSAGTVINDGKVVATGTYGVLLQAGGFITNGSSTDTTATLEGEIGFLSDLSATVHNYGTIATNGTSGAGGYLKDGGSFTNGSASDTSALVSVVGIGVAVAGAAGTVVNYGTVRALGTMGAAVGIEDGGAVVNGSAKDKTAILEGSGLGVAVVAQAGTLTNFGTILGGYSYMGSPPNAGAYFKDGGVATNGSSTDKTARIGGALALAFEGAPGTVSNFGTIGGISSEIGVIMENGGLITNGNNTDTTALIQGDIGVGFTTISSTLMNFGTIEGAEAVGTSISTGTIFGAALIAGGDVTNGSAADTTALITGRIAVYITGAASGTVTNFGSIEGFEAGAFLESGGKVTNGSDTDTKALIEGPVAGVATADKVTTVTNFGTVLGGVVGQAGMAFGVALQGGGAVTNGSSSDHTAFIQGLIGVGATGGTVINDGVIQGFATPASIGVDLTSGADLTNNVGALVTAYMGVSAGAGDTATNFGTVQGTGGDAVDLTDATARLNAESGSVFEGVIVSGVGGLVDVVGGVATASGIQSNGKVEGAGTLSVDGGLSTFDLGASLTVTKFEVGGSATAVDVNEKLGDSRVWAQSGGTLSVATGDEAVFTGTGDSFSGTVTGGGTFYLDGGTDTLSNVTLSASRMLISKSTVTLSGAVAVTSTVTATTPGLIVASGGATLSGAGELLLSDTSTNSVHGASATATLTNKAIIKGAGQLGGGSMSLVNTGTIESAYATALTLNTGTKTIVNSGQIEAVGTGGLVIDSAVDNTGTITSDNATLTVEGAVTGAGVVHVHGGEVDFGSAFTEHVTFGADGVLALSQSQNFTGAVFGFSTTGTTSLDLQDINFATATAKYSGTTASGILTVTDGTHTAKIDLIGDYLASTWELSADSGTGTMVKDPTAKSPAASPVHALVAAAASFGAATAGAAQTRAADPPRLALLAASHA